LAARSMLKSRRLPRLHGTNGDKDWFTGKTGRGTLVSGADDGRRARIKSIARIPCRKTPPETTQGRLEAARATTIDSTPPAVPPTFPDVTPQDYASANGFRISAQQTFGRPPRRQGVEARPQIGAAVPRIHPALPSARNSRARRFVSSLRRLLARGEVDRDFWWHGSGRRVAGRRGCQRADRRVHEW
jgi:hypothetical protein